MYTYTFSVCRISVLKRRCWNVLCRENFLPAGFADMLWQSSVVDCRYRLFGNFWGLSFCPLRKKNHSRSLQVIEKCNLPNRYKSFPTMGEHFLSGSWMHFVLEKFCLNYVENEFRTNSEKILAELVSTIICTFGARSENRQDLDNFASTWTSVGWLFTFPPILTFFIGSLEKDFIKVCFDEPNFAKKQLCGKRAMETTSTRKRPDRVDNCFCEFLRQVSVFMFMWVIIGFFV